MPGFVYLLLNQEGKRYVGSTNNIERRIKEHARKHPNSKYTSKLNSMELKYVKEFDSIDEARKFERLIKTNKKYRLKFYKDAECGLPV